MNLANLLLAVTLLGHVGPEFVAKEHVDLVEVNHFYDEKGRLVLDQVIFYDWSPTTSHYHVRAWRLIKSHHIKQLRDWKRGGWFCTWFDGEIFRSIQASFFRETWTQYDPELIEREFLPKEFRRELMRIKCPKWVKGKVW